MAEDFLAGLSAPGTGLGFGAAAGNESSSDDEGEGEAALSKRAAKKQRKQQLSEAEAVAERPIESGFGHAMLMKMGWVGTGAALREGGISEPVKAAVPVGKRGLTADDDVTSLSLADLQQQGGGKDESTTLAAAMGIEGESKKSAKRARKEAQAAVKTSRSWRVEVELSVPADEETVRSTMLNFPNVLFVEAKIS